MNPVQMPPDDEHSALRIPDYPQRPQGPNLNAQPGRLADALQDITAPLKRFAGQLVALTGMPPHPHMLRHACGFALADQGADTRLIQDYLGHRGIQHTVR